MKSLYFDYCCTIIFVFFFVQIDCQSIGYTFSYTLPYTNDLTSSSQPSLISEYSKSSEFSVGLTLNNYVKHAEGIQIRLTRYTSTLKNERNTFLGFVYIESAVTKYLVELESFFLSKRIFNKLTGSVGVKYSILLRSSH